MIASEDIRRALEDYKKTERPLVASFGGTAASGGYWVALPADQIYATPTTLTGSVGVFGLYPNLDEALGEIGVTNDVIRTTPYGLSSSLTVKPTAADTQPPHTDGEAVLRSIRGVSRDRSR